MTGNSCINYNHLYKEESKSRNVRICSEENVGREPLYKSVLWYTELLGVVVHNKGAHRTSGHMGEYYNFMAMGEAEHSSKNY